MAYRRGDSHNHIRTDAKAVALCVSFIKPTGSPEPSVRRATISPRKADER